MKTLTRDIDNLLRGKSMKGAILAQFDLPSGSQRLWSGAGTLTYGGNSWTSVGRLGRISGAGETSEIRTNETGYELSGVVDLVALNLFLSTPIRGSQARAWIAFLDNAEQVIPDPILIDWSILDTATVIDAEDGASTLSIRGTSAVFDFRKPIGHYVTNEQLQKDYPGDTGFDRIPGLADRTVSWTKT